MRVAREWATPLTIGSFTLIAVTGALMFFHLDSGLNKVVHEWLSWVLVAGVALHAAANWLAFKRYFSQPRGRLLMGLALGVLALSFVPVPGRSNEPPFMVPVKALAAAPLPVLAQLAGVPLAQVQARLRAAGLQPQSEADTVQALAGPDLRRQMQALQRALAAEPGAGAGAAGG